MNRTIPTPAEQREYEERRHRELVARLESEIAAAASTDQATKRRADSIVAGLEARRVGADVVDGMLNALEDRARAGDPPPTWSGVHARAVEHVVTAPGTTAATPHGVFDVSTPWVVDLAAEWTRAAMPVTAATAIVEIDGSRGIPAVPVVTTAPTAGRQNGEKLAAHSRAFTVARASTATTIDSTLFLNWSVQLEASTGAELGRAMMQAAVADEADRQVGAAIVATATDALDADAAFAHFDAGRFLPSVLLAPPSQLSALPAATDLAAAGITTVLAHVTAPVLLARGAVTGWLLPLQSTAVEPSVAGVGRAFAMFGTVAVDPAGAATWAATP